MAIERVGIELEGGWHDATTKVYWERSIKGIKAPQVGEVKSPPYKRIKSGLDWIRRNYPNQVNESCGLHVHFSLKSMRDYSILQQPSFKDYLCQRLEVWGERVNAPVEFWNRLKGENEFCQQDQWYPEAQTSSVFKESVRNTLVNFPWTIHGTVEVRVLPMFESAELAVDAVQELVQIVEAYLRNYHTRRVYAGYFDRTIHLQLEMKADGLHVSIKQLRERIEPLLNERIVSYGGVACLDPPEWWRDKYGFYTRYLECDPLGRYSNASLTDYHLGWFLSPKSVCDGGFHHIVRFPFSQEQLDSYVRAVRGHLRNITQDVLKEKGYDENSLA